MAVIQTTDAAENQEGQQRKRTSQVDGQTARNQAASLDSLACYELGLFIQTPGFKSQHCYLPAVYT
jgi:hypothetical protein